jgi:hypothetical protein
MFSIKGWYRSGVIYLFVADLLSIKSLYLFIYC